MNFFSNKKVKIIHKKSRQVGRPKDGGKTKNLMAKLRYCTELYKQAWHFFTKTVRPFESCQNCINTRYSNYTLSKPVEGRKHLTLHKDITKLLQLITAMLCPLSVVFVYRLRVIQNKTMPYYQYGLGIQKSYRSYQCGLSLGGKW